MESKRIFTKLSHKLRPKKNQGQACYFRDTFCVNRNTYNLSINVIAETYENLTRRTFIALKTSSQF